MVALGECITVQYHVLLLIFIIVGLKVYEYSYATLDIKKKTAVEHIFSIFTTYFHNL